MGAPTEPQPLAGPPHDADEQRLYTLREAAELCGTTQTALRKRADRKSIQTVMRDGVRCVPRSELIRHGLLPDAELAQAQARVAELELEVLTHRQLAERAGGELEAERQARETLERELHEQRAAAATAAAARAELEQELADAGPIRAWRLSRELRKARD